MTQGFLKKYIAYAKKMVTPVLTDKAKQIITEQWSYLRQKDFENSQSKEVQRFMPITVRTLESLIRLATAHAKLRLSKEIEQIDCETAVEMMTYSLFGEDEVEKMKERNMEPGMQQNAKSSVKKDSKKNSVSKKDTTQDKENARPDGTSKRLKTEDGDTLRNVEDKYLNMPVSKEHQKVAFKGIIELDRDVKKNNKNFLKVDELWEWVQANGKGAIENKDFLIKIVQDLDEKSKIVFNVADDSIYLL